MPELPEVETMVRGIRPHVAGREIVEFAACRCKCRPLTVTPTVRKIAGRVAGTTITAVRRRAKRIVLELSSGDGFVIEPRMTGLMLVADPPNTTHLRLEWKLAEAASPRATNRKQTTLWFWDRRGLGTVRLADKDQLATLWSHDHLGPDALEMTTELWGLACAKTSRPIKVALLDQKLVAGIGNLYASEILHLAGIPPQLPAARLSARQIDRLTVATGSILAEAIKYEGSTLGDGTYRNALNQSGSYQNAHRVYDRAGELCLTCGGETIVRIVQAQRSTFFCGRCQRRGK
jgi:formamidopyrimidine-DNA glycosylase